MTMYAALTVRKLKSGSYDEWRKAWEGDPDEMPEGGEVYILRNLTDPDEIIAFGLIEGDIDAIKGSFDEDKERKRQEDMAPHIESTGADAGAWCPDGGQGDWPPDQRAEDARSVSFTFEPLEEPLDILGFPEVELTLESDRPEALVAVRLCAVARQPLCHAISP